MSEPTPLSPPHFASQAPRDLAGWMALFEPDGLPVLPDTAEAIEDWRAHEDAVDAHLLGESISRDPLMTLKLLTHVARCARRRPDDERSDAETVTAALVLLGIGPFFRAFGPQPTVDDWLATRPDARQGLSAVLKRSHRAADFATRFAVHRMDPDAEVIREAALLHDFTELLLWLRAPALAAQIATRLQREPGLRSAQAQADLLGQSLGDLQHALMQAWHLPALLTRITDDHFAQDPQVGNVMLAIRVARHSAEGWDNPAIPDDIRDIAELLHLAEEPTRRLLAELDQDA